MNLPFKISNKRDFVGDIISFLEFILVSEQNKGILLKKNLKEYIFILIELYYLYASYFLMVQGFMHFKMELFPSFSHTSTLDMLGASDDSTTGCSDLNCTISQRSCNKTIGYFDL